MVAFNKRENLSIGETSKIDQVQKMREMMTKDLGNQTEESHRRTQGFFGDCYLFFLTDASFGKQFL